TWLHKSVTLKTTKKMRRFSPTQHVTLQRRSLASRRQCEQSTTSAQRCRISLTPIRSDYRFLLLLRWRSMRKLSRNCWSCDRRRNVWNACEGCWRLQSKVTKSARGFTSLRRVTGTAAKGLSLNDG